MVGLDSGVVRRAAAELLKVSLTFRPKLAFDSRLVHLENDIRRRGLFDYLLCTEVDLTEAWV